MAAIQNEDDTMINSVKNTSKSAFLTPVKFREGIVQIKFSFGS